MKQVFFNMRLVISLLAAKGVRGDSDLREAGSKILSQRTEITFKAVASGRGSQGPRSESAQTNGKTLGTGKLNCS